MKMPAEYFYHAFWNFIKILHPFSHNDENIKRAKEFLWFKQIRSLEVNHFILIFPHVYTYYEL